MPNTRGAPGKQPALPPKSPGSTLPPSYVDYCSNLTLGTIGLPKPREGYKHHRTSSESILIEEQPSWLDDLLNEPDTPIKKGSHRRSSSDSFAYLDGSNLSSNLDNVAYDCFSNRSIGSQVSWGHEQTQYVDANSFKRPIGRKHELSLNTQNFSGSSNSFAKNKGIIQPSPISTAKEHDVSSSSTECDQQESAQNVEGSSEKTEGSQAKQTHNEMESKRVKQQFAQRSRVRKLQYIAELERNVQALQAEGLEISGEIEFLSQQNLILSLENKALKQRFDSLSQEHLIKCFEHDMLEREMARIRTFIHQQQFQQQQQPAPHHHSQKHRQQQQQHNPSSNHSRNNSRDLDLQFSNLSLKHQDGDGPLHI